MTTDHIMNFLYKKDIFRRYNGMQVEIIPSRKLINLLESWLLYTGGCFGNKRICFIDSVESQFGTYSLGQPIRFAISIQEVVEEQFTCDICDARYSKTSN